MYIELQDKKIYYPKKLSTSVLILMYIKQPY